MRETIKKEPEVAAMIKWGARGPTMQDAIDAEYEPSWQEIAMAHKQALDAANARIAELEADAKEAHELILSLQRCQIDHVQIDQLRADLARLKAEGEWIVADQNPPEIGDRVIFICSINDDWTEPQIGYWTGKKTQGDSFVMDCGDEDDWLPCTHYRPLPPAPLPTPHNSNP